MGVSRIARAFCLGCAFALGLASGGALAGIHSFSQLTAEEEALLPKWCAVSGERGATKVPPPPSAKVWLDLMGPGFKTLHHYCWAMVEMWRAEDFKLTPAMKNHLLSSAVNNLTFVVVNSPPDFVLHPEIFTQRGKLLARLGKHSAAMADFEKAVELKPNYWPAYVGLAELMRSQGRIEAAREWVDKGLANAPDSKALLRLRNELQRPATAASR